MLPTFNDTKGLGFSFRGRPFCIGTKTRDLRGLDVVFRGVPFAGALVEQAEAEQTDCLVIAAPTAVSVTGHTSGCILALTTGRGGGRGWADIRLCLGCFADARCIGDPRRMQPGWNHL